MPVDAKTLQTHLGVVAPQAVRPPAANAAGAAGTWMAQQPAPFSAQWYAQHPTAWQVTHPYANEAAIVASAAALAGWLAIPYATVQTYVPTSTTVVEVAPSEPTPVIVTVPDENTDPAATDEPDTSRSESAGAEPAGSEQEWMTVGLYQLKPSGASKATRMVHLAVNRAGELRGTQYDMLSEHVGNVQGKINKSDLLVAWTVGESAAVTFETSLPELTKPTSAVRAQFADGESEAWEAIRVTQ